MWHKALLVWLVTWITTKASPLQPANPNQELPILIPDLSNVDSYALQRIQADKFLTLWHINVLSGAILISDEPWTVLIPHNAGLPKDPKFIINTEYTRQILLNHVIIGDIIDQKNISKDPNLSFYSLADTQLKFSIDGDTTYVNGVRLTGDVLRYKNGIIYVIEKVIDIAKPDYLKYVPDLKENIFNSLGFNSKTEPSINQETVKKSKSLLKQKPTSSPKLDGPRKTRFDKFRNKGAVKELSKKKEVLPKVLPSFPTNSEVEQIDPMSEFFSNAGFASFKKTISGPKLSEFKEVPVSNESFLESLKKEAKVENSLAREFYYHLMDTNTSNLLFDDEYYTAIIATDDAFYDYYPIDWGFNPFLVKNFTKDVLLNHIIPGNINLHYIKNGTKLKTLGGKQLTIHHKQGNKIEINGEPIPPEFEIEMNRGRIYFVDKLLFVDHQRVNSLRDQYPFLETGPLISYPWPTSPFLSHLVKRLKESPSSKIFVDLLLKSSVTHRFPISDDNLQKLSYSAFVPSDKILQSTFTKEQLEQLKQPFQSFDSVSGSGLSAKEINNFVLKHLFQGYIMEKDFNSTGTLMSMAGNKINYVKLNGIVNVGGASIIGSQEYLYNLGAIYHIDNIIADSSRSSIHDSFSARTADHLSTQSENDKRKGISVPFPINPSSGVEFPSISNSDYRFETRTEVSFSRQINNGDIIPITKEDVEREKRRTA